MKTTNIVSIKAFKAMKEAENEEYAYRAKILSMDKLSLLNEMVTFQEERAATGNLTPGLMIRGKILFKALEENAETDALKSLSRSYRRHLEMELMEHSRAKRESE
jgi:hypothetical protein